MLELNKKHFLCWLIGCMFILYPTISMSQCSNVCGPNLVPNGNFEASTGSCVDTLDELSFSHSPVQNWFGTDVWPCYPNPTGDCNVGSTPDYFNQNCIGPSSYEQCGTGDGAVGVFNSVNVGGSSPGGGTVSQNREYVQVKLSSPLIAGKQYCASMLVRSNYQSQVMVSADGIGMWLTDQKINIDTQNGGNQFIGSGSMINATPQVQNPLGNIIDSTCTSVSGTFCATGGEEWLVIGNFLPDAQMTTNDAGFFGVKINYMVIDDVNLQSTCPPDPQLTLSNHSIICGTPIDAAITNAPTGSTIEWLSPANFTGNTTGGSFSDSPNATTEYAAVVMTDYGCGTIYKDTLRDTVDVNCGPEIILNVLSDTLCEGSCTDIEATISGGSTPYTVTWDNGLANGTGPYTICPTTTTTYTATVTDGNGDVDDTTITVYVGTPDSTYILHPICNGGSIDLYGNTITSSGIYPEAFINRYGCDSIEYNEVVVLPASGTISVSKTDLSDCSLTDGTITFDGLLPDSTYSISYNHNGVVGPQNYSANLSGQITITGLEEGSYSDFIITILGCTATLADNISIISPNSPTADAGSNHVVCENEFVTLTASAGGNETISWNNGVTNGDPFSPAVGTQIYTVTITNPSGCSATDETTVTVNAAPTPDAGQDIAVCEGDDVTLEINGNNTYSWNQGVVNGVPFSPPPGTTSYTVTAVDQNGCTATDEIDVVVSQAPDVTIFTDDSAGCAPFTVEFSSGTTNGGDQCLWDFGDASPSGGQATSTNCGTVSHTYENPGCYDVTLTQTLGATNCSTTFLTNNLICVEEPPVASFDYNPSDPSEISPFVHFNNQSAGADNFSWTFNDSVYTNEENPSHSFPMDAGNYNVQLIAQSVLGCNDTLNSMIYIDEALLYYVPNTFTPDANGSNDFFLPIMTSGFDPNDYKMLIFNRWGEVLFESFNPNIGWDGTYNGKIVPDGVYVWTLEFKDNNNDERMKDRGNINVIR